jgi:hypothetical protein
MQATAWFIWRKHLPSSPEFTHYRIWRNHLRWFKPMPGVNDDGRRAMVPVNDLDEQL